MSEKLTITFRKLLIFTYTNSVHTQLYAHLQRPILKKSVLIYTFNLIGLLLIEPNPQFTVFRRSVTHVLLTGGFAVQPILGSSLCFYTLIFVALHTDTSILRKKLQSGVTILFLF